MRIVERLNELSFVIGAFFTIVALVLFANMFIVATADTLSIFTATSFLIFGVAMMFASNKKS
jgi:hypothetical protein